MHRGGRELDQKSAEDMVSKMRANVPRDTSRLYNGITWQREGEEVRIIASAHSKGRSEGVDYAFLVEYGTHGGRRSRAAHRPMVVFGEGADRAEQRPTSRPRRIGGYHPGTAAQPYFWPAVDEVMAKRPGLAKAMIDEGAEL